jgi:hypothetical protein
MLNRPERRPFDLKRFPIVSPRGNSRVKMAFAKVMPRHVLPLLLALAAAALAQKYDGLRPPKKDLPYLKQAASLIPTEAVEAAQEGKKDDVTYVIPGAASPVVTPLAEPVFLIQAEKIVPESIELYKLDPKSGRRELVRRRAHALLLEVTRLTPDGVWKIEVDESLEPGEYALSPKASNQAFCFQER